ncbi:alpha-1,2-Mannosidase [Mycena indigotica]|uniref:alpha-1,2-Mannosidase n=1 Tax=Mycena indigotica TaxID=2126181 RepID=A0A8H6SL44_9AGAR|nr:alpha-1,2-Mannosidase [Mycena indigotica]KAF7301339.1 alpha-1,2-Mannosidase [Mycena indigotica]
MKWRQYWPEYFVALLLLVLQGTRWSTTNAAAVRSAGWTPERKLAVRNKVRDLWYHGFNNYMTFAFPMDELTPLSCSGQGPDWDHPENYASNDVRGNYSLTLIDVLDSLVVLGDRPGFEKAVKDVIESVSFDVNTRPQVFETTIRVLGGLLSGHIFASQTNQTFFLPWYKGELLQLAHDLGERLLPAFSTPTGLPYARINLRHGVLKGEGIETCSAGAGSLMLEFATLSRLTGDDRFEKAAYKAFFAVWNRRSDAGLVGNTINIRTGTWTKPEVSGIGAGIDSFHEYALKWYILRFELFVWFFLTEFPAAAMLSFWTYGMTHTQPLCAGPAHQTDFGSGLFHIIAELAEAVPQYRPVNMVSGDTAYWTVDSLSAFWPGLQVLAGDVQNAIKLHLLYYNLWRKHSGLPEVYDTNYKVATAHQYPLRPEFIESSWYLYRATKDSFYLDVGERVLFDITTRAKVPCGLTGIKDLRTNARDDRMESFALSETLKYLYLLFDEENPLHRDDSNYVFTTEGHLLTLGNDLQKPSSARRKMRKVETHQCPAYRPHHRNGSSLSMGIRSRGDVDYARALLDQSPSDLDESAWSPNGWCERPNTDLFAYDFILSAGGKLVAEDISPSRLKLDKVDDGFILHNVTGIRINIVQRLDGKGYDVRKLGHYDVRSGNTVYIADHNLFASPDTFEGNDDLRPLDIPLRFFTTGSDPLSEAQTGLPDLLNMMEFATTGYTALFGPELGVSSEPNALRIEKVDGVPVYREPTNANGCEEYHERFQDVVLVAQRGECTFLQKLIRARDAGAAGVLVISNENIALNPTADAAELEAAGDIKDVALVVLTPQVGQLVHEMLDSTEERGGQVMVQLDPEGVLVPPVEISREQEKPKPVENKILYLNGHPLLNTRIII